MEELDPRLAGTADYLRKIVAQLASIVSCLEPEESNNEYASLKSDVLDLRLMIKAVIERLDDPAYVVKVPNRDDIIKRMENASADDEPNKRIAALEAKVQRVAECQWSTERAVVMLTGLAERLEAVEKRNTTIDNLCGRLEALEKRSPTSEDDKLLLNERLERIESQVRVLDIRAQTQAEITNGLCSGARKHDIKLGNLSSALNDLHSRLADIEGNAVLIRDGVIVPTRKG